MLIKVYMPDKFMTIESPKYKGSNIKDVVVHIEPSKALYQKVQKMKNVFSDCDADYIEAWNYTPEWEELTIDGQELTVECCKISVTRLGNVFWHGIIKHSNMLVHTEEVPITKLFSKFINTASAITGTNNSTPYEDLKLIADFVVDSFDINSCIQITTEYILDNLDKCTDKELKEQKNIYGYEE